MSVVSRMKVCAYVRQIVDSKEVGILNEGTKEAIKQLFYHALLGKPLDRNTTAKWEKLGMLKSDKLVLSSETAETLDTEVVMMALAWDGYVKTG